MIGVVTTSYPRGPDDWAGSFVRRRVETLIAAGAAVEVVAAGDPGQPGALRIPGPSLFYGAGAPEVLEVGGAAALVSALGFSARLGAAVAARAADWSAVETHWLAPCALVTAAVAPRLPQRAFAHGGDVALLERLPGGSALARTLVRAQVSLVFASADLRTRFANLCGLSTEGLRAEIEPAPFDSSLFPRRSPERHQTLRRQLGCGPSMVLGVGRLVPVKGFDVLIRAIARLPRARRPQLVLVGEGPEREALRERAARVGISLRLPGAVARASVADWMTAADVYVQPSVRLPGGRAEGMPVAVREALAVGVPVIASSVGGMVELVEHPGLTLVPPDQPEALARTIAQFL